MMERVANNAAAAADDDSDFTSSARRKSSAALFTSRPLNQATLSTLPPELHLLILAQLAYPDTLALKLASRHFHALVAPKHTVVTRVTWLLDRASAGLPIPKTSQVKLHNDAVFVANAEVRGILRSRLRHRECVVAWQRNYQRRSSGTEASGGVGDVVKDADGNEVLPGYCLVRPGLECESRGGRVMWEAIERAMERGEGCSFSDEIDGESVRRWVARGRRSYLQQRRGRHEWRWLGLWHRDEGVVWRSLVLDLLIVIGIATLVRWKVSKDWDLRWSRAADGPEAVS